MVGRRSLPQKRMSLVREPVTFAPMLTVLCPNLLDQAATLPEWLAERLRRAQLLERHEDDQPVPDLPPAHAYLAAAWQLPPALSVQAFVRFDGRSPIPTRDNNDTNQARSLTVIPVNLRAGLDHIVMADSSGLNVEADEARALISSANEHLAQDQVSLSMLSPQCWSLNLPSHWQLKLYASALATGRNIDAYMPAGPDARKLRALLNEIQMLWHQHPVNERRFERNQAPVSTVWAEGYALPIKAAPFQQFVSDHPVSRGLAHASGLLPLAIDKISPPALLRMVQNTSATLLELTPEQLVAMAAPLFNQSFLSPAFDLILTDQRSYWRLRSRRLDSLRPWRKNGVL